jgi:S-adenosylmethionine hydrolase
MKTASKTVPAPVILTTDFGYLDEYVGVLKGVILSIDRSIAVIDLCHAVPAQDIPRAARLIADNYRFFPDGSVHLCIVDPGVGTKRRIIAIQAAGQLFVGPDNGVFSTLIQHVDAKIFEVTNRDWFLDKISTTFHGRDIMAPVAARLALGAPITSVGARLGRELCATISLAEPLLDKNVLTGEVVGIDRYGNIRTNIRKEHLDGFKTPVQVLIKSLTIKITTGSYGDISSDQPAALINSSNELEICVRNSNCAALLDVELGDQVLVRG